MMMAACAGNEVEFALMLAVQFTGYLRPRELATLSVGQALPPLPGAGTSSWALLLSPETGLVASKIGAFDESVLLDSVEMPSLGAALARQVRGKSAEEPLWRLDQRAYGAAFGRWAEATGVDAVTVHLTRPGTAGRAATPF